MDTRNSKGNLNSLRKQIQRTQIILIILITILISSGALLFSINANSKSLNANLQSTSELINDIYGFIKEYNQEELILYVDHIVNDLPDVDAISIINSDNRRIYHTNHQLINTMYDGTIPDFSIHTNGLYTENDDGPSGPQRRTYSALYDEDENYLGFLIVIRLQSSIKIASIRTIFLFLIVTLAAILIEIVICASYFRKIKKQFYEFTEDFEGTKFLVDSMRANNHDFTNKLHVILGLIQIGEYQQAINYIQNISIIQRETVSAVMNSIENSAFAALLIGKIARASECNVKFILMDDFSFKNDDIKVPSEALVTITGNLIDNAIDSMNFYNSSNSEVAKQLHFGVFTKPGEVEIIVQDNGCGISDENKEKVFENGFSTKGTGRGVGLYHTKNLIESLNGRIFFESEAGKGTCFTVIIKSKD